MSHDCEFSITVQHPVTGNDIDQSVYDGIDFYVGDDISENDIASAIETVLETAHAHLVSTNEIDPDDYDADDLEYTLTVNTDTETGALWDQLEKLCSDRESVHKRWAMHIDEIAHGICKYGDRYHAWVIENNGAGYDSAVAEMPTEYGSESEFNDYLVERFQESYGIENVPVMYLDTEAIASAQRQTVTYSEFNGGWYLF